MIYYWLDSKRIDGVTLNSALSNCKTCLTIQNVYNLPKRESADKPIMKESFKTAPPQTNKNKIKIKR